jgi:DNA polymerase elongation subunit (family B)
VSRKVLTIDIETSPHMGYFFQTRNVFIQPGQIIEPTRMLSFAAKWEDKPRVLFESEFDFGAPDNYLIPELRELYHRHMVERAFELLDEADVVVGYNSDGFDLRHLRREFRLANLGQPSPFASVDLWKVIKKEEEWASHKLSYITERYKLTGKMQNDGFPMWVGCLNGDLKMWRQMRRYNKRDVVTTEELKLACHDIVKMPALSLYDDEPLGEGDCPTCRQPGQRRGYAYTATRRYPRYYCPTDAKWFSGNRSDRSAGVR